MFKEIRRLKEKIIELNREVEENHRLKERETQKLISSK